MIVIGLVGTMGAGKDATAAILARQFGFSVEKHAKPIKDMLRAIGLTEAHLEGPLKEKPCDLLCGQSPRYAMKTLGTEWGRGLIGERLWERMTVERIRRAQPDRCVVSDCRFHGEVEILRRELGAVIWRIVGRRGSLSDHASETEQASIQVDLDVDNSGSLDELERAVVRALMCTFSPLQYASLQK